MQLASKLLQPVVTLIATVQFNTALQLDCTIVCTTPAVILSLGTYTCTYIPSLVFAFISDRRTTRTPPGNEGNNLIY